MGKGTAQTLSAEGHVSVRPHVMCVAKAVTPWAELPPGATTNLRYWMGCGLFFSCPQSLLHQGYQDLQLHKSSGFLPKLKLPHRLCLQRSLFPDIFMFKGECCKLHSACTQT